MAQTAKQEVLLAVDLYNRPRGDRCLEAYVVHMMIAWLNLLHAVFERDHIDYRFRQGNRRFVLNEDGDPKTWDLRYSVRRYFPNDNDPVRNNLEFFVGLRNKIEHQYAAGLGEAIAGKAQALLLNFESVLAKEFGADEALGNSLRFPVFVSQLDADAVTAFKKICAQLPRQIKSYIEEFDASVGDEIRDQSAYEFRVYLVEKLARTPNQADLAIEFVRRDSLTEEQLQLLDQAVVMIRDRQVEVANLNKLKPSEVIQRVRAKLPWFNSGHHIRAWKFHKVRPPSGAADPTVADARYCVYDRVHNDYIYTEAWGAKLIKELGEHPENYPDIVGNTAIPQAA